MEKKKISFITTNNERFEFAKNTLAKQGIVAEKVELRNKEIQSDKAEEIAIEKALNATKILGTARACEDTELSIKALNGFPGPYLKYVQSRVDSDLILKLLKGYKDRSTIFKSVLVYAEPTGFHKTFTTILNGNIATKKKGSFGKGWDNIFELKKTKKNLAEYSPKEKLELWSKGYKLLGKWLKEH